MYTYIQMYVYDLTGVQFELSENHEDSFFLLSHRFSCVKYKRNYLYKKGENCSCFSNVPLTF